MVKRINILGLNVVFVFRHKWDRGTKKNKINSEFKDYRIGFWFRKSKIVGRKHFSNPKKWKNNSVNSFMLGINLLICKVWVELDFNGKHLN